MLYGINLTSLREWPIAQRFYNEGIIDFVEILIDNFRNSDPELLKSAIQGMPYSIHIMFSRFIEASREKVDHFYEAIKPMLTTLQPMYISDHLARFTLDGMEYPTSIELDYINESEAIMVAAAYWQQKLGHTLYLETFPSVLETGIQQAAFMSKLLEGNKDLGVLFDVSNLFVAELNGVNKMSDWYSVMQKAKHFHIGGYFFTGTTPQLVMDSHNTILSTEALNILSNNKQIINRPGHTIVIERDYNYDEITWREDILNVREALEYND